MTEFALPWGENELKVALPEHWTLQQVARPELRRAAPDWPDRLAAALTQPGTGLGLDKLLSARKSGKVVLVLEDVTRHSPLKQILPVILREIRHAHVDNSQIEIVFACGMHPAMTPAEVADKIGPLANEVSWRCNNAHARKAHVKVGSVGSMDVEIDRAVVEADLRILVASVSPHLQAGFGGGYKMFVPGCASIHTIRMVHRMGLGRSMRQLVGTDSGLNGMRLGIDAAGQLLDGAGGKTFSIQYLLDDDDLPSSLATGEVIPTHRQLAKQCAVACGIVPSAPADVVIANAFPRDFDLWQSFKAIANTIWAARPDGVIICSTRCLAGANNCNAPPWPLSPVWTRRILRWMGPEALSSLVTRLVPRLGGEAAFFVRMATQMLNRNHIFFASPQMHQTGMKFPGLQIFPSVEAAMAAAGKILGNQPQRVTVFPTGGTTFPVPSA